MKANPFNFSEENTNLHLVACTNWITGLLNIPIPTPTLDKPMPQWMEAMQWASSNTHHHTLVFMVPCFHLPAIVFVNFGLAFWLLFLDSFLVLDPVVLKRVLQTGEAVRASNLEDTYCKHSSCHCSTIEFILRSFWKAFPI